MGGWGKVIDLLFARLPACLPDRLALAAWDATFLKRKEIHRTKEKKPKQKKEKIKKKERMGGKNIERKKQTVEQ